MKPDCTALTVGPAWRQERLVWVGATEALRLCREGGYEAVSAALTGAGDLGRQDFASLRAFISRARLSKFSLSGLDDRKLLALLRTCVKNRDVVALRECAGDREGEGSATADERRLVRALDAKSRGRLNHAGRRYKLVASADLRKLSDRDSYEVVRHDDATRVLDAIAKQAGPETGDLRVLLGKARAGLTADWRPPLQPDGLVLLRRIVIATSVAPDTGPALTPSQIKKLANKSDWIEIEIVDDEGEPYTGHYRIVCPDDTSVEGTFNADGEFSDYNLDSGVCKLYLGEAKAPASADDQPAPATEEQAPPANEDQPEDQPEVPDLPADEQPWISLKFVNDAGESVDNRRYRLQFADGSAKEFAATDGEIVLEGVAAGDCVLSLLPDEAPAEL
jgi:hypothetical protein